MCVVKYMNLLFLLSHMPFFSRKQLFFLGINPPPSISQADSLPSEPPGKLKITEVVASLFSKGSYTVINICYTIFHYMFIIYITCTVFHILAINVHKQCYNEHNSKDTCSYSCFHFLWLYIQKWNFWIIWQFYF